MLSSALVERFASRFSFPIDEFWPLLIAFWDKRGYRIEESEEVEFRPGSFEIGTSGVWFEAWRLALEVEERGGLTTVQQDNLWPCIHDSLTKSSHDSSHSAYPFERRISSATRQKYPFPPLPVLYRSRIRPSRKSRPPPAPASSPVRFITIIYEEVILDFQSALDMKEDIRAHAKFWQEKREIAQRVKDRLTIKMQERAQGGQEADWVTKALENVQGTETESMEMDVAEGYDGGDEAGTATLQNGVSELSASPTETQPQSQRPLSYISRSFGCDAPVRPTLSLSDLRASSGFISNIARPQVSPQRLSPSPQTAPVHLSSHRPPSQSQKPPRRPVLPAFPPFPKLPPLAEAPRIAIPPPLRPPSSAPQPKRHPQPPPLRPSASLFQMLQPLVPSNRPAGQKSRMIRLNPHPPPRAPPIPPPLPLSNHLDPPQPQQAPSGLSISERRISEPVNQQPVHQDFSPERSLTPPPVPRSQSTLNPQLQYSQLSASSSHLPPSSPLVFDPLTRSFCGTPTFETLISLASSYTPSQSSIPDQTSISQHNTAPTTNASASDDLRAYDLHDVPSSSRQSESSFQFPYSLSQTSPTPSESASLSSQPQPKIHKHLSPTRSIPAASPSHTPRFQSDGVRSSPPASTRHNSPSRPSLTSPSAETSPARDPSGMGDPGEDEIDDSPPPNSQTIPAPASKHFVPIPFAKKSLGEYASLSEIRSGRLDTAPSIGYSPPKRKEAPIPAPAMRIGATPGRSRLGPGGNVAQMKDGMGRKGRLSGEQPAPMIAVNRSAEKRMEKGKGRKIVDQKRETMVKGDGSKIVRMDIDGEEVVEDDDDDDVLVLTDGRWESTSQPKNTAALNPAAAPSTSANAHPSVSLSVRHGPPFNSNAPTNPVDPPPPLESVSREPAPPLPLSADSNAPNLPSTTNNKRSLSPSNLLSPDNNESAAQPAQKRPHLASNSPHMTAPSVVLPPPSVILPTPSSSNLPLKTIPDPSFKPTVAALLGPPASTVPLTKLKSNDNKLKPTLAALPSLPAPTSTSNPSTSTSSSSNAVPLASPSSKPPALPLVNCLVLLSQDLFHPSQSSSLTRKTLQRIQDAGGDGRSWWWFKKKKTDKGRGREVVKEWGEEAGGLEDILEQEEGWKALKAEEQRGEGEKGKEREGASFAGGLQVIFLGRWRMGKDYQDAKRLNLTIRTYLWLQDLLDPKIPSMFGPSPSPSSSSSSPTLSSSPSLAFDQDLQSEWGKAGWYEPWKKGVKGFERLSFTSTSFSVKSQQWFAHVVYALGSTYSDHLWKSTTHLLCPKDPPTDSEKLLTALTLADTTLIGDARGWLAECWSSQTFVDDHVRFERAKTEGKIRVRRKLADRLREKKEEEGEKKKKEKAKMKEMEQKKAGDRVGALKKERGR